MKRESSRAGTGRLETFLALIVLIAVIGLFVKFKVEHPSQGDSTPTKVDERTE